MSGAFEVKDGNNKQMKRDKKKIKVTPNRKNHWPYNTSFYYFKIWFLNLKAKESSSKQILNQSAST